MRPTYPKGCPLSGSPSSQIRSGNAELDRLRCTTRVAGDVAPQGLDSFGESVDLAIVLNWDLLGQWRGDFRGRDQRDVALAYVLNSNFIDFQGVDALTVLVDQLDNVLQEELQTIALEV